MWNNVITYNKWFFFSSSTYHFHLLRKTEKWGKNYTILFTISYYRVYFYDVLSQYQYQMRKYFIEWVKLCNENFHHQVFHLAITFKKCNEINFAKLILNTRTLVRLRLQNVDYASQFLIILFNVVEKEKNKHKFV